MMVQITGWYVSLGLGILAAVCWFTAVFYFFRATALRSPGVSWFEASINPQSGLTDAGHRARKKGWVCMLGAVLCYLLSWAIGVGTGAVVR